MDDPTFMTQVLFSINSMGKLHLNSCQHTIGMDVNDEILYTAWAQPKVIIQQAMVKKQAVFEVFQENKNEHNALSKHTNMYITNHL